MERIVITLHIPQDREAKRGLVEGVINCTYKGVDFGGLVEPLR